MKIIIRLVGYSEMINNEKYVYEYKCIVKTIFNFEILKIIFNKYNEIISSQELNDCTLTCNSKNLKKDCLLDNNITNRVFIFTGNTEIKNKLICIFKLYGYKILLNNMIKEVSDNSDTDSTISIDNFLENDEIEINKLENDEIEINKLENDEIEINKLENDEIEINKLEDIKQNLDIFKDEDFLTLIKIYKNRGYLFNDFYKYINSAEIINFNKIINETELNDNINFIKNLNLNFSDENIKTALEKTSNHINLAIRYLLFNI
jgi:hypothetical protein